MNLNNIKIKLAQHYGSQTFFKGFVKESVYTEGIKELLETAQCYWLYDIIQTEMFALLKNKNPDTYYFTIISKDSEAKLILKDYKSEIIYEKGIPFTDFPEGSLDLVIGFDGQYLTTCLPSEN